MESFHADTAVESLGDLRFRSQVVDGWDIGGNPNGGYVAALMMRAVVEASRAESGHGDPVSSTHHFLRPAQPGPVDIELVASRLGRTLATFGGVLRQEGKEIIRSLVTLGSTDGVGGPELVTVDPPDLAPYGECVSSGPEAPNFARRLDIAHDPRWAGYVLGRPSGEPKMGGWLALANATDPPDAIAVTMLVDALPPTIFNTGLPIGWAPTVELTVHYRNRATAPRLAATYTSKFISGGMMSGDFELWDPSGVLVAEARQLALLPRPAS